MIPRRGWVDSDGGGAEGGVDGGGASEGEEAAREGEG
jgi:hypothetical protein